MLEISSAALGRRRGIKDNRAQGYIPFPLESQDRKNSRERLRAGLVSDGREFLTFLQQRGKAQCSPRPKGGRGPRVGGNWLNLRSRDSLGEFLPGQGHFLGHILNTDAHQMLPNSCAMKWIAPQEAGREQKYHRLAEVFVVLK